MGNITFSVIIAVAPDRTPEVLDSLERQNYPRDSYEIIVKRGHNTSENRNSGVKEARGEYIAFVDDDAIVEPYWLKKAEEFFERYPEIDVVGGPQLTPPDETTFGYASGIALASVFGGASIRNRYRKGKLNLKSDERELTSANIFCKKKVFEKVLFNKYFWPGEDPVFFNELVRRGIKLAYCPDIYIYHRRRNTPVSLFKQIFRYGYVRPKIKSIKKTHISSSLFAVPSIFIVYLIFLPLLLISRKFFVLPLLIYILATIILSFTIAIKERKYKELLILPFVFFLIHIGYGTGFLCGLIRKLKGDKNGYRYKRNLQGLF